jgi:hypothetical protein
MILAAPSKDIMNKLARGVLALYSYDPDPEPEAGNIHKELDQALHLIARCPVVVANAFAAKKHYFDNESLYIHYPKDDLSTAENFLYSARHDNSFTLDEAQLLDLSLVLHAEHGGGNNSAFTCRVLSSTGRTSTRRSRPQSARSRDTGTEARTRRSWRCLSTSNGRVELERRRRAPCLSAQDTPKGDGHRRGPDLRRRSCRVHHERPARRPAQADGQKARGQEGYARGVRAF